MPARSVLAIAASACLAAVVLTGCTGTPAAPATPSGSPTPSAGPTIDPGAEVVPTAAPQLRPGGTGEQNKLYWDQQIRVYWTAQAGMGTTQALIDHLVASGYDRSQIEITYDATAIGLGVDSIEASVRFGDDCLLADVRPDRWNTVQLPVLGTGKCLVGWQHPVE